MKVYSWLIDLIHRRKNCPTGMISGWVQKVTDHRRGDTVIRILCCLWMNLRCICEYSTWLHMLFTTDAVFIQESNCTPSDEVRDFVELEVWKQRPKLADSNSNMAQRALEEVQGHLVIFPLGFLRSQVLRPAIISKEGLLPATLWTWESFRIFLWLCVPFLRTKASGKTVFH